MTRKPSWFLGLLIVSACGGRTGLLETWDRPSAGAGGSPAGGRGGSAPQGGNAPIIGGTFGEGGTFATGGALGEGGSGGTPAECALALADCAAPSELACRGQRKACAGALLAQFKLDSGHGVEVTDVARSRDRRVAVAGSFRGELNVGGNIVDSPPEGDQPFPTSAFVASFDTNGKPEWVYAYRGDIEYKATALRFAPNGDIVFQAGTYYDWELAAVVTRLSPLGELKWQRPWGHAGHITPGRLAIDNDGRIWLSGTFRSTFDFPGVSLDAQLESSSYLLELAADGGLLRAFSATPSEWSSSEATGVAVDDEDNVLVVGTGHWKNSDAPAAFLEKYSPDGQLVYAKTFTGTVLPTGVTVDRMMRPTLFAHFAGTFGNEATFFEAKGLDHNLWLAQYSREGSLTWQQAFEGNVTSSGGTADPFDNIILAGTGALELDGTPLQSPHAAELGTSELSYLMKLRPDGTRIWVHALGGAIAVNGIATDNDGFIWLGTQFRQQIWVDDSKLSTTDVAGLLLKLSP